MNTRKMSLALVVSSALCAIAMPATAQDAGFMPTPTPLAASAPTAVPSLVPYSGSAIGYDGKPLAGDCSVTFLIYKEEQGGEPLWSESQKIAVDATGHYKAQLGATYPDGLPLDLFATGDARWLEVQIAGQQPVARVLLASVPYALKAADSATLGGLPASAFMRADQGVKAATATATGVTPDLVANVTTTGGTAGYLPVFSGAATVIDSPVFVNGANVGIGTAAPTAPLTVNGNTALNGAMSVTGDSTYYGSLVMPSINIATASHGYASNFIKVQTSAYNSATKSVVSPRFQWQALVTGNNTSTPGATLDLYTSTGTASPTPTGFYFNTDGTVNFATGQTFPGTVGVISAASPLTASRLFGAVDLGLNTSALETTLNSVYAQLGVHNTFTQPITFASGQTFPGAGTITGITAGTALTGGGTSGNVTLNLDTTAVPTLAGNNTFTGNQSFNGTARFGPVNIFTSSTGLHVTSTGSEGVFAILETPTSGSQSGWAIQGGGYNAYSGVYGYGDDNSYAGVIGSGNIGVYAISDLHGAGKTPDDAKTLTAAVYAQAGTISGVGNSDIRFPAGLFADGGATTSTNLAQIAVLGTTDDNEAGRFDNNSESFPSILLSNANSAGNLLDSFGPLDGGCAIAADGDFFCTGTLSGSNVAADGRTLTTYGVQAAENWYEDAGSGTLQNGVARIDLDANFAAVVNTGVEYHVFLTPEGDCKGLYVTNKGPDSFEVHELGGGRAGIAFDYRIMAKRKGYEQVRLEDVTEKVRKQTEERLKRRAASATPASHPAIPPVAQRAQLRPVALP